ACQGWASSDCSTPVVAMKATFLPEMDGAMVDLLRSWSARAADRVHLHPTADHPRAHPGRAATPPIYAGRERGRAEDGEVGASTDDAWADRVPTDDAWADRASGMCASADTLCP
ncbi:MAG: hypothetical protein ACTHW7_15145, partial [Actinomycetaceae bacterium]